MPYSRNRARRSSVASRPLRGQCAALPAGGASSNFAAVLPGALALFFSSWQYCLAAWALTLALGCGASTGKQEVAGDKGDSVSVPAADTVVTAPADEKAGAAQQDAAPAESAPSAVPAEEDTAAPKSAAPPAPPERFLMITSAGPLVCELSIAIGGHGQEELLNKLVEEALAVAQSLGNGTAEWNALVESRQFQSGQFGNAAFKTKEERNQAIARYDWNRDGRIERDEMRRFLTRNQRNSSALVLRSNDPLSGQNAAAAPGWQLLDTDGDQTLSADELRDAPARLRSRDTRDDDLLVAADLAAPVEPANPERRLPMPIATTMAFPLSADADWKQLWSAIIEAYPNRRKAATSGAQRAARLFDEHDRNGNGTLSAAEQAGLAEHEPELKITARFGNSAQPGDSLPPLSVVDGATTALWTSITTDVDPPRLHFQAPGLILEWTSADKTAELTDPDKAAADQFASYDGDNNGYLDRDEASSAAQGLGSFDALDADADDKVYPEELRIYLQRQRAVSLAQLQLTISRLPDPVFAALDVEGDGRLGAREIAGAATRLLSFDANADGRITLDEIPDRITAELLHGGRPTEPMRAGYAPASVVRTARQGPAWFQRMDTNGDGDVSRREFLGTAERFDQLDTDSDGYIEAREVE